MRLAAELGRRTRRVGIALGVVALHLVVVALVTASLAAAVAALAWIALTPLALRAFAHGGRAARTAVSGLPGLFAATVGVVTHVGRTAFNGPSATDITGIAVALAGFFLVGIAFVSLFEHTRRWTKLLALPLAFVLLQLWVLPVLVTGAVATNAPRGDGPAAASLGIAGARDVSFRASDGVPLRGWLVPGRTRAAVVVLHGSHGTRNSTRAYIRFLHDAGYTVLAYDARGHGASGGHENAFGWYGNRDLAGAVAWLRGRPAVDASRIAALGLSMGGEEALRAAGRGSGSGLRAVVADGAGSSTQADTKLEQGDAPLFAAVTWIGMRTVEAFSGDREPRPLTDVARGIRAPVLLIASNRRGERRIDTILRARIGRGARLWYLADTGHTQGLSRHPAAYRQRVLAFLESALR